MESLFCSYLSQNMRKLVQIDIENIRDSRKDIRKITYSKVQDDYSVVLVTKLIDNDLFLELIQDKSVHIIF